MSMNRKRVVAVITFEDDGDNIQSASDAATWFEAALAKSTSHIDVTVYSSAKDAAQDEAALVGDFANTDVASVPVGAVTSARP